MAEIPPLPTEVTRDEIVLLPLEVSIVRPLGSVVVVRSPVRVVVVPAVIPLPKKFWFCGVPDQSMPLTEVGFLAVSIKRASIRTCLVGVSSWAIELMMA
ncbi:MAG: hypothetical protein U1G07_20245 [Verrucomicrobiota bacterium]